MATVISVARKAGVSSATVSRVLNGSATVSSEMRERVMAAVNELGFHLNPMAQGLRKGQTNTVALLVGDIEQTHFSALTKQVQAALEGIGLDLLLYNLGHSQSRLESFLARAIAMRLRGVVLALSDSLSRSIEPLLARLEQHGVELVCIGQNLTRFNVPSIVHEERVAATRSVDYLLAQGRTRIAYVGHIKGSTVGSERYRGYRRALEQAGLPVHEELVWDVVYRYAAGRDAVIKALERGIEFDGLQAGSDELAMGALAALQERGLAIPSDVAVVGFGGIDMAAYTRPPLTTLSSHPEEAAAHLRRLFLDGRAEGPAKVTWVERSLIRRVSA